MILTHFAEIAAHQGETPGQILDIRTFHESLGDIVLDGAWCCFALRERDRARTAYDGQAEEQSKDCIPYRMDIIA
jgi:hypothetical protein